MQQKLKQKAKTSIYKGRYKQRNKNKKIKNIQTNKNMDKQTKIWTNK